MTYLPIRQRPHHGFEGTVTPEMREIAIKLCEDMHARQGGDERRMLDFGSTCAKFGVECFTHDGAAQLARAALWSTPDDDGFFYWPPAIAKLREGWTP